MLFTHKCITFVYVCFEHILFIAKIKRSRRYSGYYNSEADMRVKSFREDSYLLVL